MRRRFAAAILLSLLIHVNGETCYPQNFGRSSVVCVCNSTNCGDIGSIHAESGKVASYQSSMGGKRFERSILEFLSPDSNAEADLTVDVTNQALQEILGFGGAFTDAAGLNWASLSDDLQEKLIYAYYGPDGLEYNIGRVPMGGCDFSTRDYTYDDTPGDFELKNFALAEEDLQYKIPMIRAAMNVSKEQINIFGSPWSAPAWMKTNGKTFGKGALIGSPGGKYYKTWADYFVKFYEAYKEKGITTWGFTEENEPTGAFKESRWQAMAMSPYTQRDFLKMDLGPALFNATNGQIKIMILDDQRPFLPWWADVVLDDPVANFYAAGVAVHWYRDEESSSSLLETTHKNHPDKFILYTEACVDKQPADMAVLLGSWERAESYAHDIIDNLRHYVTGWVDWNLCLDLQGGPNWVGNFVDAPIIVDKAKQAFYKQPMYYALAHFTKFLPRGSVRLNDTLEGSQEKLMVVSLLRPDKLRATVILNENDSAKKVLINDSDGKSFLVDVEARSMATCLW